MTPAAYHCIAARGPIASGLTELALWLLAAAMAPLVLSVVLEAFVASTVIVRSLVVSPLIGASLTILSVAMRFGRSVVAAHHRH